MHTMTVQTKYYRLLKNRQKTVELRLYDDKRRLIKIGDEILFSNLSDANDTFIGTVVALHRAENFKALCNIINPKQAGMSSTEELVHVMKEFYPIEKQNKWGVVGIEIKTVL